MQVEHIQLYISAAADLRQERETLSRAVSEVPVPMGWRILFSPIRGEAADLEAVHKSDLHLLILGSDIRAPVGAEWSAARRGGKQPALFLKTSGLRTAAAEDFIRHVQEWASWITYQNLADLRMQALKVIAQHVLEQASYYSLSLDEVERVKNWRDGLDSSQEDDTVALRSGIGESSIILTTERYLPKNGVLIQPPGEQKEAAKKASGRPNRENP